MGIEIVVEGLAKSFGRQVVWQDVSLELPAGEISVLMGPSGTGKSVFLKTLVGLLRPDQGSVRVAGRDLARLRERDLYEVRKLFGVLFQDGALFGSMSLYDNIAFPLREHTRKREAEIRRIVLDKKRSVSRGEVLEAGLVSSDADSARVLLVVDSTVSNTAIPKGQRRHYRIQLDLRHERGSWLASNLEFVS